LLTILNVLVDHPDQQSLQCVAFRMEMYISSIYGTTIHLSFRTTLNITYYIDQDKIPKLDSHHDLRIIISNNLSWRNHYTHISVKAYRTVELICRIFNRLSSFEIISLLTLTSRKNPAMYNQIYPQLLYQQLLTINKVTTHVSIWDLWNLVFIKSLKSYCQF